MNEIADILAGNGPLPVDVSEGFPIDEVEDRIGVIEALSMDQGRARRARLDAGISQFIPPELRNWVGLANELNPVTSMERAGQAGQDMLAPDATGMERVGALGNMLSNTAGVVAPAMVAGRAGVPVANALEESLMGWSAAPRAGFSAFRADEAGSIPLGAQSPAEEVATLLRGGNATDVTDDMMAAVDPQEMWRLYEEGATGVPMPMDVRSRMARAQEMGFDTGTPLYHGTAADFAAFSPDFRGGVADAYTARRADWFSDSQTTAQGYADMAARDAPVARLIARSEAAERAGDWDAAHEFMAQAERLEQNMPEANGQLIAPTLTRKPQQIFDADGFGPNEIEMSMRDQMASAQSSGDVGMELRNLSDHPDWSVEDPALHRGIFDPSNIRSRFARFDPRLSHLGNLGAAMGGLAILPNEREEGGV